MRIYLLFLLMCISLKEFAQTIVTKPVSSNWLLVNTLPKKIDTNSIVNTKIITEPKVDSVVKNKTEVKFYADKDSLKLGEGTFLNWDISTEHRVLLSYSIDNVKFDIISDAFASRGKHRINPKVTTLYKIRVDDIEKILKVSILSSPKSSIEYFYFEKDEVKLGESTLLKWSVNNITNVTLETSINGVNWSVEESVLYGNIGEKIVFPKRKIYYRLVADDATIIQILNITDN